MAAFDLGRGVLGSALAAGALALVAAPASARVTVEPATATQGSQATVAFNVRTDRTDAGTTKLEVTFPAEHPLSDVSTQPKPGWDIAVERASAPDRVAKVTWTATAQDGGIGPGHFDLFVVNVGPLPSTAQALAFTPLQTYSDGQVVAQPAAVLALSPTAPADAAAPLASASATAPPAAEGSTELEEVNLAAADDPESRSDEVTLGLAVGTTLILTGVATAGLARRRGRTPGSPAT